MIGSTVDIAAKWWPRADLMLYVDDLTVAVAGCPIQAAKRYAQVVNQLISILEGDLRMIVNDKKSVVVASSMVYTYDSMTVLSRLCPRVARLLPRLRTLLS